MKGWRTKPPRTLKRKAALATVKELRQTLQFIAQQIARTDIADADRMRFITLQLQYSARISRLGVSIDQ